MVEGGRLSGYGVDYFISAVRETLDDVLATYGFEFSAEVSNDSAVYWHRSDAFIRFSYLAETAPQYVMLISVGIDGRLAGRDDSEVSTGVWRFLPSDSAERIADWRFDSDQRLRAEVTRAWRDTLRPYVLPALDDRRKLEAAVRTEASELDTHLDAVERLQHLERARAEFESGHYDRALRAYGRVSADHLEPGDKRRILIARRALNDASRG